MYKACASDESSAVDLEESSMLKTAFTCEHLGVAIWISAVHWVVGKWRACLAVSKVTDSRLSELGNFSDSADRRGPSSWAPALLVLGGVMVSSII